MKKLKQSQYYGIGLLVLMLVVFWAVFKVLAPTTLVPRRNWPLT